MQDRLNELQFENIRNEISEFLDVVDRPFLRDFRSIMSKLYKKVLAKRANEDRLHSKFRDLKRKVETQQRMLNFRKNEADKKEAKPVELENVYQSILLEMKKVGTDHQHSRQKLRAEEDALREMRKEYMTLQKENEETVKTIKESRLEVEMNKDTLAKKHELYKRFLLKCNEYRLEKEKKKAKIQQMFMKQVDEKEKLSSIQKDIKISKMCLTEMITRSKSIETQIRRNMKMIEEEQVTKRAAENTLEEKTRKNEVLVEQIDRLQNELQVLQGTLELKHHELLKAENDNVHLEETKRKMEEEKERALRAIQSKKAEAKSLEEEDSVLQTSIKQYEKEKSEWTEEVENEAKEISRIKRTIDNYRKMKERIDKKISTLSYQEKFLSSQLRGNSALEERKKEELMVLEREISKVKYDISGSKISNHEHLIKSYQIQKTVEKYQTKLHHLKTQISDAKLHLEMDRKKMKYFEGEIEKIKKLIERTEVETESEERQKTELSNQVVRKSGDLDTLKNSLFLLRKEIKQTKDRASRFDRDIIREKQNLWNENCNFKSTTDTTNSLNETIAAKKKMLKELEKTLVEKTQILDRSHKIIEQEKSDMKLEMNERLVVNKKLTFSSKQLVDMNNSLNDQNLAVKFGKLEYDRVCRDIVACTEEMDMIKGRIDKIRKIYDPCNNNKNSLELKKRINNKKKQLQEKRIVLGLLEEEKEKRMNLHMINLYDEDHKSLILQHREMKKKLINVTDEVSVANSKIREKEMLYKELRTIMKTMGQRKGMDQVSNKNEDLEFGADKLNIFEKALQKKKRENEMLNKKLMYVRKEKDQEEQNFNIMRKRLKFLERKVFKMFEEEELKDAAKLALDMEFLSSSTAPICIRRDSN